MCCKPQIIVQLDCSRGPVCVLLLGCGSAVGHGIKDAWSGVWLVQFFLHLSIRDNSKYENNVLS